jgi:hypothetical protein
MFGYILSHYLDCTCNDRQPLGTILVGWLVKIKSVPVTNGDT